MIAKRLSAKAVVVGYDFRFGRARAGTGELLKQMLPELVVEELPPLRLQLSGSDEATVISSSLIRQQLLAGETHNASQLLGRPYCISGVVVGGDKRGRRIGYPTANIETDASLMPAAGVYAVQVELEDGIYNGMLNLGTRPTFGGQNRPSRCIFLILNETSTGIGRIIFNQDSLRASLQKQQRAAFSWITINNVLELLSQVGQTEQITVNRRRSDIAVIGSNLSHRLFVIDALREHFQITHLEPPVQWSMLHRLCWCNRDAFARL